MRDRDGDRGRGSGVRERTDRDRRAERSDRAARAVSDLIGFVLIFGLVASMVGITYFGGVTQLQSVAGEQQIQNTERGFRTLAENVADLRVGGAPSRTTSLAIREGTVGLGEPIRVAVNVSGVSGNYTAEIHPVVYRSGEGASVVYANGMVMRTSTQGEPRVVDRPSMLLDDRAVVPLVRTTPGQTASVGGDRTIRVRTTLADREVYGRHLDGEYDVRLTVTSPRHEAWTSYMESRGATCSAGAGSTTCEFEAESVRIQLVRIGVAVF